MRIEGNSAAGDVEELRRVTVRYEESYKIDIRKEGKSTEGMWQE
jgi:hypothetical protein